MKSRIETVHTQYSLDGQTMMFEDNIELEWIDATRAKIKESSDFFDDFWLLYGDILNLEVSPSGFQIIAIEGPSDMLHYQFGAPPIPKPMTDELLKLGANWECDMGYSMTLHVPKRAKNEVAKLLNLNFEELEEVFSGLQEV